MSHRKTSWQEFQETGLLWWINRILHTFGWAIVPECDETSGEVLRAVPARTDVLGFSEETNETNLERFRAEVLHCPGVDEDDVPCHPDKDADWERTLEYKVINGVEKMRAVATYPSGTLLYSSWWSTDDGSAEVELGHICHRYEDGL